MVEVHVDSKGVFSVVVPSDLVDAVKEVKGEGLIGVEVRHDRKGLCVASRELQKCMAFLKRGAEAHLDCETKTDRLIVYGGRLEADFWIDRGGQILPNGCNSVGEWWKMKDPSFKRDEGSFSSEIKTISVGFYAGVLDRHTHKRKAGETIEWSRIPDGEEIAIDTLNAWALISASAIEDIGPNPKSMPYSAKAAVFFNEILCGLCAMARGIDDFFADAKRIDRCIRDGVPLLPSSKPQK